MDIAESILDLIGHSPLVRLSRLSQDRGIGCMLAMKMETSNPGGSAKDRPALRMIPATLVRAWPSSPPSAGTTAMKGGRRPC